MVGMNRVNDANRRGGGEETAGSFKLLFTRT